MIELLGVSKEFHSSGLVLSDLNLKVRSGEFVAILGASGSGKSTLIRLMAGLEKPSPAGKVKMNAEDRGSMSYVFQEPNLLPWLTVTENVRLPLKLLPADELRRIYLRTKKTEGELVSEVLEMVDLVESKNKYPLELSGGMKMRASIARAMVTHPHLLLMDEPFAALDEFTRHRMQLVLSEIWETLKITIVFVTHSIDEAVFLGRRQLILGSRPGRIIFDHESSLQMNRTFATRNESAFFNEMNFLRKSLQQ